MPYRDGRHVREPTDSGATVAPGPFYFPALPDGRPRSVSLSLPSPQTKTITTKQNKQGNIKGSPLAPLWARPLPSDDGPRAHRARPHTWRPPPREEPPRPGEKIHCHSHPARLEVCLAGAQRQPHQACVAPAQQRAAVPVVTSPQTRDGCTSCRERQRGDGDCNTLSAVAEPLSCGA